MFQKDLIVWKLYRMQVISLVDTKVSEGLNSVETIKDLYIYRSGTGFRRT